MLGSTAMQTHPDENPPTAKCYFEKSTKCKMLDPNTVQFGLQLVDV